jgi:hypothetical protein
VINSLTNQTVWFAKLDYSVLAVLILLQVLLNFRIAYSPPSSRHQGIFKIPTYKTQKGCMRKNAGPTRGFVASLGVGPGATVGTVKIGYPRVQAPSQDERQDGRACPRVTWLRLLPLGSRELRSRYVPHDPGSPLLAQGSSRAATCLMAPAPTTRPRGSSGTATCPLGSSSYLLAQGSSGAATCFVGGLYGP